MDEIYKEYAMTVYKYLLSMTHDEDLSEELTQETFCQAIRTIHRYDESCRISTWLCAIAKNVLITYRRSNPAHEEFGEKTYYIYVGQSDPALEEVIRAEEKAAMIRRIHALREPYREVVYMRAFGDLSFREIGDVCGKTENWARVTFYRGKEQLRKDREEK